MANLFVKDEAHQNATKQYVSRAQEIEMLVTQYTAILQAIVAEKNMEGRAATALADFASLAEGYLGDELAAVFQRHQTKFDAFMTGVEADDEAEIS